MLRCEKRGAPRSRGQFPVSPRPSILPPRGSWSCGQLSLPAPTRLLRRRPPGATVTVGHCRGRPPEPGPEPLEGVSRPAAAPLHRLLPQAPSLPPVASGSGPHTCHVVSLGPSGGDPSAEKPPEEVRLQRAGRGERLPGLRGDLRPQPQGWQGLGGGGRWGRQGVGGDTTNAQSLSARRRAHGTSRRELRPGFWETLAASPAAPPAAPCRPRCLRGWRSPAHPPPSLWGEPQPVSPDLGPALPLDPATGAQHAWPSTRPSPAPHAACSPAPPFRPSVSRLWPAGPARCFPAPRGRGVAGGQPRGPHAAGT